LSPTDLLIFQIKQCSFYYLNISSDNKPRAKLIIIKLPSEDVTVVVVQYTFQLVVEQPIVSHIFHDINRIQFWLRSHIEIFPQLPSSPALSTNIVTNAEYQECCTQNFYLITSSHCAEQSFFLLLCFAETSCDELYWSTGGLLFSYRVKSFINKWLHIPTITTQTNKAQTISFSIQVRRRTQHIKKLVSQFLLNARVFLWPTLYTVLLNVRELSWKIYNVCRFSHC
jgi:hypothetical protein